MSMIGLGYLRRVVGVELNLVHGRGGLEARVGKELLEVLDGEVGNTNVLDATRLRSSAHVSRKSQSGRCFLRSSGSVDDGQCYGFIRIKQ
jgi:hypothetical protein